MYKAKNVDTDKALEALEKTRDIQSRECGRKNKRTTKIL